MKLAQTAWRLLRAVVSGPIIILATSVAFLGHGKALTAGLIDLMLVMLIAFRWGFVEAGVASVAAVVCLDYFYMVPIFTLYIREPQDWISSAIFLTIALTAGHFADRIKQKAIQTEREQVRLERLYLISRDIILLDRRHEVGGQLTRLIVDIFKSNAVALWDAQESRMDKAGEDEISDDEIRATFFHELPENDFVSGKFKRVLRLGSRKIGALYIADSTIENPLDARSVDSIAYLAALALERAHSFIAESNAEAAKLSEQLRSTVLDGLAHAFKTPLTTIQSASSGLLEINQLQQTEKELVRLIDEEAARLTKLTNQVLQTAALDSNAIKIHQEKIDVDHLFLRCKEQAAHILNDHPLWMIDESTDGHLWADIRLLEMALLQMLDNASKYARPESPITLRAISTDTETVFSIQNEGSFVAPEERTRIFQRFYRSPGSQHKASGTGIGLSVVQRIAEAHRGRVWIDSEFNEITTCFFALPHIRKEI